MEGANRMGDKSPKKKEMKKKKVQEKGAEGKQKKVYE
jgi:hypothetical protein